MGEETARAFAVLGYPLGHTLSPRLHSLIFRKLGLPHIYLAWEAAPGELEAAAAMFRRNLAGFNVTAPYKKEIIKYLDDLHISAEVFGAVNTVKNDNGRLLGFNTDGTGFVKGLERAGYEISKKRVLLIGAGGAAQAVALELAHRGCIFTLANRNVENAYKLQIMLEKRFPRADAEVCSLERIPRHRYQCIVNATPVGMGRAEGKSPIDSSYLRGVELVYDLIYNPPVTRLLELAEAAGCLTVNGLAMLVYQGLQAQEFWLKRKINAEMENKIIEIMAEEVERWPRS